MMTAETVLAVVAVICAVGNVVLGAALCAVLRSGKSDGGAVDARASDGSSDRLCVISPYKDVKRGDGR